MDDVLRRAEEFVRDTRYGEKTRELVAALLREIVHLRTNITTLRQDYLVMRR